VNGHGKTEAHVHAARVGLDGRVDEILQLGELDDLVEALLHLTPAETQHDAVDEDVLAARDLRMEAGAQLDQRRNAALHVHRAGRGLGDAGHELQRRALAAAITPDHGKRAALGHVERHVLQRLERLFRLQVAHDAALQQRALERGELPAAEPAIDLADVTQRNGRTGRHYTTSANESRRRSKSQ
jgi:hypothetical protein